MDAGGIQQLIGQLLLAIRLLSGYPVPADFPELHVLPLHEMQAMLCKGPCGEIKAYYIPARGIFINDQLDFVRDTTARSVLLHELVHHVQEVSGRFNDITSRCDRWLSREREAYRIQNEYLGEQGERRRFLVDTLPRMCQDGQTFGAQD